MFKRLACSILLAFGRDHDWRRARKGEAPGVKTCRRCGATQPIRARVTKLKAVA